MDGNAWDAYSAHRASSEPHRCVCLCVSAQSNTDDTEVAPPQSFSFSFSYSFSRPMPTKRAPTLHTDSIPLFLTNEND
ncbi:MAG: hypothetical protein H2170_10935 [Opitutus sp.]|nr:hypothetical protein [Opitutus sp.]